MALSYVGEGKDANVKGNLLRKILLFFLGEMRSSWEFKRASNIKITTFLNFQSTTGISANQFLGKVRSKHF